MTLLAAAAAWAYKAEDTYSPVGVTTASTAILGGWHEASRHFGTPVTRTGVAQRFHDLAATWRESRGPTSSATRMILDPAYQQIIALGPRVVPHILDELARRPDHWFWALEMLTGANPVHEEDAGDIPAMIQAWLNWGQVEDLAA